MPLLQLKFKALQLLMVEQKVGPRPSYSLKKKKTFPPVGSLNSSSCRSNCTEQKSDSLNYQLLYFRDYFKINKTRNKETGIYYWYKKKKHIIRMFLTKCNLSLRGFGTLYNSAPATMWKSLTCTWLLYYSWPLLDWFGHCFPVS